MSNVTVQEALNNTLVMLDALTVEFGITGLEPLIAEVKAALAEIEKCEPVAYMYESPSEVDGWSTKTLSVSLEKNLPPDTTVTFLYTSPQPSELYAGDCVAYLYKDNNGGLKICNESPPPDKSFPVFITNLSFLDVARTVLDDCSDLIIKHGGVNLWKELVAKINRDYKQLNTKG